MRKRHSKRGPNFAPGRFMSYPAGMPSSRNRVQASYATLTGRMISNARQSCRRQTKVRMDDLYWIDRRKCRPCVCPRCPGIGADGKSHDGVRPYEHGRYETVEGGHGTTETMSQTVTQGDDEKQELCGHDESAPRDDEARHDGPVGTNGWSAKGCALHPRSPIRRLSADALRLAALTSEEAQNQSRTPATKLVRVAGSPAERA